MFDKDLVCTKFCAKYNNLEDYDEKLMFYANVVNDLEERPSYTNLGSIRLNLEPIIEHITEHAVGWKTVLGEKLAAKTKDLMTEFEQELHVSITLSWQFTLCRFSYFEVGTIRISQ